MEYLVTLQKGYPDKYREKFSQADAIIIDNLQELGLFRQCLQDRFSNLLKAYFADYKQVVLFSRQPLDQIKGLANPNLISQFEWGLEVEMEEAC
jgi:chromosomal replication initiation ATPase DnaA